MAMDFLTQRLAHLLWQTEEKPSLEGMMDENARALARIRDILADNALDDFQCVEKIVLVLEELGVILQRKCMHLVLK